MLHQLLWSLAVALIPAGLMLRALGLASRERQPVPIEIERSSADGTEPR
jgi:hypothetical protein